MPIDPIKIPQNVHIEDRIVGPLTLKQILIVGAGAGFSYALYGMLTNAYGALALPVTIMVWIPAAIAAAFAFIKINDISMFKLLLLMMEQANKPATRTWTPHRGITINIRTFNTPEKNAKTPLEQPTADKSMSRLEELTSILDHEIKKNPSPTEESDDLAEEEDVVPSSPALSVDRSRVTVSNTASGPVTSIFRDLTPHA